MSPLCLVKAVDGFGQRMVVAVALAADRRLDTGLGQPFGVANGTLLRAAIRVVDQAGVLLWLANIKGLLQGIQNKVSTHGTTDAPADDAAGKNVDDESDGDEPPKWIRR